MPFDAQTYMATQFVPTVNVRPDLDVQVQTITVMESDGEEWEEERENLDPLHSMFILFQGILFLNICLNGFLSFS